jgi:hypothetical protein
MRRCLELLPPRHPLRPLASRLLEQCERSLALEARLPAVLQGKAAPASAPERLEYARLCGVKKVYAAAARLYAEAFAADPKLADNLATGHRYSAACASVLAAAGQGQDAGRLDARERARLRRQALAWLRADLGLWAGQWQTSQPQARAAVQQQLRQWQKDADLSGIRDAAWLVNLPADDLRACRQLWADVAALLGQAGAG